MSKICAAVNKSRTCLRINIALKVLKTGWVLIILGYTNIWEVVLVNINNGG